MFQYIVSSIRDLRDVWDISEEEMRDAMGKMKNKKAVVPENTPIDAWKCLDREGIEWLTKLFEKVWNTGKMQDEGREGIEWLTKLFGKVWNTGKLPDE